MNNSESATSNFVSRYAHNNNNIFCIYFIYIYIIYFAQITPSSQCHWDYIMYKNIKNSLYYFKYSTNTCLLAVHN